MITSTYLEEGHKPLTEVPFRSYAGWPELLVDVRSGNVAIDDLAEEEFVNIAAEFMIRRGCHGHSGFFYDRDAGAYFCLTGNGTTYHWILYYVKVRGSFDLADVHNIRLLLNQRPTTEVVHYCGRGTLPPARIVSRLCWKAVERIDTRLLKRWVFDPVIASDLQNLQSEYIDTIMNIGTVGLEATEASKVILSDDFNIRNFGEFVERLGIGKEGRSLLKGVNFLPFDLLRTLQQHPKMMREMNPRDFEVLVAELLTRLEFQVELTPRSNDGGKDIVGYRMVNGIPLKFYFECKRYAESNKVGVAELRSLLGTVNGHGSQANIGVLVTSSKFTKGSIELMGADARLDGKDFDDLQTWLNDIMTDRR
ncbi:MAG: restriction endonuclease [Allorhizobium sp.]